MAKRKESSELLDITRTLAAAYDYHAGFHYSRFLKELKTNKRIYGVKCPKCKKVYVPPRIVCRDCFVKMEEFVPVSDQGTLVAFTVTTVPYIDPSTGETRKLPFTAAYVRLDGSDSNIMHCLDETDESKIKTGMRVQAVFSNNRTGDYFTDIKHFRIIKESSDVNR